MLTFVYSSLIVFVFVLSGLSAQNSEKPAYLNTSLSAEQRAADRVHCITVEEKVSQLVNQSRAIPRLNVLDYDWWSEALHGVANNGGITTFPFPSKVHHYQQSPWDRSTRIEITSKKCGGWD